MPKTFSWTEPDARAALAKYEGVVRTTAKRLLHVARPGRALDFDDLVAEGRVAVLEALVGYAGFGVEERTFVKVRVRQRLIDAIRRMDVRTREEVRLVVKHARSAANETAEGPTRKTHAAMARRLVSMDSAMGEGEPLMGRLTDSLVPPPHRMVELRIRRERLDRALESIPPRQREAVELCIFQGMHLREIGERMGISESRVCQLQKQAVCQLRKVPGLAA